MIRGVAWSRPVAVLLLVGLGTGLLSLGLPEEIDYVGYYDGDGDDAGVAEWRVALVVDLTVPASPTAMPAPTSGDAAALATPAKPVRPSEFGLLAPRSPPT